MDELQHKIYENRVRRIADRQGLKLEKSRRRDPRAIGYGMYRLTDPNTNTLVAYTPWGDGYGLSLDEAHRTLIGEDI